VKNNKKQNQNKQAKDKAAKGGRKSTASTKSKGGASAKDKKVKAET